MFDPEELNSKINQSFKNQEKIEAEAQGLENKLLENYEFKKSMLPTRNWGQLLYNISKQAINPGANFGSYGIAKAALLSLMKQYALETAELKIRSNGVNADRIRSGLLDKELVKKRAKSRGLTEEEYMEGNLLKAEVLPEDVSNAFISLALMRRTTGAILTVDGGNVAAMVR